MIYRFGGFQLDSASGELTRGGHRVRLRPQPCTALLYLLERQGQFVSRAELQRTLWPAGTHVQFAHGLNSCIKQVRAALGDTRIRPRFIETLTRRGYRFVAPAATVGASRRTHLRLVLLSIQVVEPAHDVVKVFAAGLEEEVAVLLAATRPKSLAVTRFHGLEDSWQRARPYDRTEGTWLISTCVRHDSNGFRITTRLVNTADGSLTWAAGFDGCLDGMIRTQTTVARWLAEHVLVQLRKCAPVGLWRATTQITKSLSRVV